MSESLIGFGYFVVTPDLFFPRHFRVIEECQNLIRIKNAVETFWMHRSRFEAAIASGQIRRESKYDEK